MSRTSTSFSIRKNNWGNKNIFPELIYIDSNAVLDIIEQRTYGPLIEEYLKELIKNNGMITWSSHLLDELTDYYHYELYTEEAENRSIIVPSRTNASAGKILENTATDLESSGFAKSVVQKVKLTTAYLEQFGMKFDPDTEEMNDLATNLYSNYGSNLKDSKHVAIATLAGTNNILTQDSGFLRYPSTNVFGASKGINQNINSIVNDTNIFTDLRNLHKSNPNSSSI